jgi:hypothetical protein
MPFKRRVLFIGGYDPKNSKHIYYEQQKELALYAERFGTEIQISEMQKHKGHRISWRLHRPEQNVTTQFDLLTWDDLVRQSWQRTTFNLIHQAGLSLWEYLKTGRIWHMARLSFPLVCAAVLPIVLAVVTLVFSLLTIWLLTQLLNRSGDQSNGYIFAGITVSAVCALLAYRQLQHNSSTWFMRVVAFARTFAHERLIADHSPAEAALHRHRIHQWACELSIEMATDDVDEILIVGYSAGSILAPSLLVELAKAISSPLRERLAMLTLGNCLPVAASLPSAKAIHHDLQSLSKQGCVWIDFTAPADWGSVHGIDCARLYAGQPQTSQRLALSPRFHVLFTPMSYEALRKNKFRLHQQYLKCTEILEQDSRAYDYFELLTGTKSLATRYSTDNSAPT